MSAVNVSAGHALRVKDDGSFEEVPNAEINIGDVVVETSTGKHVRITTREHKGSPFRPRLEHGESLRVKVGEAWYMLWCHGTSLILNPLEDPTKPFSNFVQKHELIAPFPYDSYTTIHFVEVLSVDLDPCF